MRTLIAANWKMHGNRDWIDKVAAFDALLPSAQRKSVDVLICPPALYIAPMAKLGEAHTISIGAQNCHHADTGAHTGEISAEMIKQAGARYVILGHSERRAAKPEGNGETDADVKAKAYAAARHGLIPIICVGETLAQREAGEAEAIVSAQLAASLPSGGPDWAAGPGTGGGPNDGSGTARNIVIAYEPIWAIGTGKVPTLPDIDAMHNHIRSLVGADERILYGGSVKPTNAKAILAVKNVNGALIGGAGLDMHGLADITRCAV